MRRFGPSVVARWPRRFRKLNFVSWIDRSEETRRTHSRTIIRDIAIYLGENGPPRGNASYSYATRTRTLLHCIRLASLCSAKRLTEVDITLQDRRWTVRTHTWQRTVLLLLLLLIGRELRRRRRRFFFLSLSSGTRCASDRECRGGECVLVSEPEQPPEFANDQKGSWSEWKEGTCSSGCLQRSKGARVRRRFCENRNRGSASDCKGLHYDVLLCKDEKLCKKKRRTIDDVATLKCSIFGEKLAHVDGTRRGLQAAHEADRPWMACAIFCRRKDIVAYYAPRVELNDLGLDPYFPDGTWCHTEEGQDYFCRQHHCLPESFRFGKKLPRIHRYEDDELGPQNAQNRPGIADRLMKYLTSGPDGLPLLTSVSRGVASPFGEDDWIDKDYMELPPSVSGPSYLID